MGLSQLTESGLLRGPPQKWLLFLMADILKPAYVNTF